MPDEYAAVGVPWVNRGVRLEETLDVLERYWAAGNEGDLFTHSGRLFSIPETVVGLKPEQRPKPPIMLAAFTAHGLRRVGRRADGWLPVAMPLPYIQGMWATILDEADQVGRDAADLRMALRVNPELTDVKTSPEQVPSTGTLGQYADYARAAAEAGVHELFVDFGQSPATLAERLDLAARFIDEVRAG